MDFRWRHMGLVAKQHVDSSWSRNQTHVPCFCRQILNHTGSSGKLCVHILAFQVWGQLSVSYHMVETNTQSRASVDSKAGRRNSLYCLKDISDFTDTLSGEFLKTQRLFPNDLQDCILKWFYASLQCESFTLTRKGRFPLSTNPTLVG